LNILKYHGLDGLRGVAALTVLVYHPFQYLKMGEAMPTAYLAVDLFFILSGFVMAHAYENALVSGRTSALHFMKMRVARLAPAAAIGTSIGAIATLINTWGEDWPTIMDGLISISLNFLFIPAGIDLNHSGRTMLFPVNPPLWSLFFELLVNALWCLCLVQDRRRAYLLGLLSAALLVYFNMKYGTLNIGWTFKMLIAGFFRVSFGFCCGLLIYHLKPKTPPTNTWANPAASVAFLGIVLAASPGRHDFMWALLSFPAMTWLSIKGTYNRVTDLLGGISYPLYAIHSPIMILMDTVSEKLGGGLSKPVLAVTIISVSITLAYLIHRFWEQPMRMALQKRLSRVA
jgi:peptidoglycan/LPS O-acetylase OafA/YrhL